ncbi:DUF2975 domain-containing protein [Eggerthella sinensis]|nr:DUF2975 domain-containing protein [Eggerthella sinensis]
MRGIGTDEGEGAAMSDIREKIKTSSTAVFVLLLLIAGVLVAVSLLNIGRIVTESVDIDHTVNGGLRPYTVLGMQILLAALLVYVAFIFRRIGKEETPFFPGLSRRVKLAAPFLFLVFALPRWVANAVISVSSGKLTGAVFDEISVILLAVAVIVFCIGHILEYGWRLQDENNEII